MARIKAPPRVAQPDLERQPYNPEAQAMSSAIIELQLKSNQASDDGINHDTEKKILPKMATVTGSEQPITEKRSAAEELVNIGHRLALANLNCPQCLSKFPDMGIMVSQICLYNLIFWDLQLPEINYHRSNLIAFTEPS
jgi:hypothetical protein